MRQTTHFGVSSCHFHFLICAEGAEKIFPVTEKEQRVEAGRGSRGEPPCKNDLCQNRTQTDPQWPPTTPPPPQHPPPKFLTESWRVGRIGTGCTPPPPTALLSALLKRARPTHLFTPFWSEAAVGTQTGLPKGNGQAINKLLCGMGGRALIKFFIYRAGGSGPRHPPPSSPMKESTPVSCAG